MNDLQPMVFDCSKLVFQFCKVCVQLNFPGTLPSEKVLQTHFVCLERTMKLKTSNAFRRGSSLFNKPVLKKSSC